MNFKSYIEESINDKGLFKAIFLAGIPGAGKNYTLSKINNAQVQPRMVSSDKVHEFIAKKRNINLNDYNTFNQIVGDIKNTFRENTALYINSMLPLWVDSTSSNLKDTLRRIGILEYFGYDIAMLWVNTNLETAIKRAKEREREVPEEFIRKAAALAEENKTYYQQKIPNFFEANNNEGESNNTAILKLFRATTKFFLAPIQNPVGTRNLAHLRAEKASYLIPSLYAKQDLQKAIQSWYNT